LLNVLCTRGSGVTVKEMAEELNVCEKTFRRGLETFQQTGFSVVDTVGVPRAEELADLCRKDPPWTLLRFRRGVGSPPCPPLSGVPGWHAVVERLDELRKEIIEKLETLEQACKNSPRNPKRHRDMARWNGISIQ